MNGYLRIIFAIIILAVAPQLNAQKVTVSTGKGVLRPSSVPVVEPISRYEPYFQGGMNGRSAGPSDYKPTGNGGFTNVNGSRIMNYMITTGAWQMVVGDKPLIAFGTRNTGGSYTGQCILSDVGVAGKIRVEINGKKLEDFKNITTTLYAGIATWICEDKGVKVELIANHFADEMGCALTLKSDKPVNIKWFYEDIEFVESGVNYNKFKTGRFTEVYVGSKNKDAKYENKYISTTTNADTMIMSWGYNDYNKEAVDAALKRLWFRPFPTDKWAQEMKDEWFNHWIGRGLNPLDTYNEIYANTEKTINKSVSFWNDKNERVIIKTGDERFDNVVKSIGSRLISNFEYPGYPHGSNYMKYGKINCGLYGHEAAGFHDEVGSTLKFLAGTQCVKGRMRYFSADFRLSNWAEEINPYFIEQVWYHYCWTGDKQFLFDMWPSVRRAMEHFIATSDPDHDGFYTGYYENWNGDGKDRGGKGAFWTGMGVKALRAAYSIASMFEGIDWEKGKVTGMHTEIDYDFRERYKRLLDKAEKAYETLYNSEIGSYSSQDWDGYLRNMPDNEESNYMVWRGLGDKFRNYSSIKFIRDNYHVKSENGIIEFCNFNWPVCWSNHYDSFAEGMSSVASAAMTNDIDNYWPILKSVTESVYANPECTVVAGGHSILSLESDQMLMMAIIDNIFGIKPQLGDNKIVLRPSFPSSWTNPQISIKDISYKLSKDGNKIFFDVETPTKRDIEAMIPVKQGVESVLLNGKKVDYELSEEVNCARVIVKTSEPSCSNKIVVNLIPNEELVVSSPAVYNVNNSCSIDIKGATVVDLSSTQNSYGDASINNNTINFTPRREGRTTIFAKLNLNNVSWYYPIEADIKEQWKIDVVNKAWDGDRKIQAQQLLPIFDNNKLRLRLSNNTSKTINDFITVKLFSKEIKQKVNIPANGSKEIAIDISDIRSLLSPGTIPFKITLLGETKCGNAVNWDKSISYNSDKVVPLDIKGSYNIPLSDLYSDKGFMWRIDYTGATVGVDWRDTLTIDKLGYRLFAPPAAAASYGLLPEQFRPAKWVIPSLSDTLKYPLPFRNIEMGEAKNNVIALVNCENNRGIPSSAVIKIDNPSNIEKVYMLTANLTKTCKSYYPGAEIVLKYDSGEDQLIQLIPPHNMPCVMQTFCPTAFNIRAGEIQNAKVMWWESPSLAVTDIVCDGDRKLKEIEIKCVTTETIFGLVAMTLLSR